jgi:hypothetical protein
MKMKMHTRTRRGLAEKGHDENVEPELQEKNMYLASWARTNELQSRTYLLVAHFQSKIEASLDDDTTHLERFVDTGISFRLLLLQKVIVFVFTKHVFHAFFS